MPQPVHQYMIIDLAICSCRFNGRFMSRSLPCADSIESIENITWGKNCHHWVKLLELFVVRYKINAEMTVLTIARTRTSAFSVKYIDLSGL